MKQAGAFPKGHIHMNCRRVNRKVTSITVHPKQTQTYKKQVLTEKKHFTQVCMDSIHSFNWMKVQDYTFSCYEHLHLRSVYIHGIMFCSVYWVYYNVKCSNILPLCLSPQRYFVLEKGMLTYGKSPAEVTLLCLILWFHRVYPLTYCSIKIESIWTNRLCIGIVVITIAWIFNCIPL